MKARNIEEKEEEEIMEEPPWNEYKFQGKTNINIIQRKVNV